MKSRNSPFVALCPHCQTPFHYVECRLDGDNDTGGWKVRCKECDGLFKVELKNPRESSTDCRWQVEEELYDWLGNGGDLPVASHRVKHNIHRRKTAWEFKADSAPLYCCPTTNLALDALAYQALRSESQTLQRAWEQAENYLLACSGPSSDRILVCLDVPCECGNAHSAVFFAPTYLGASSIPLVDRCLLAHVSNVSLDDRLNCLASKSEIMELLEKLLIRWHYTADQILLATPFVGHQWMKPDEIQEIWDWLFQNLDPDKVTLLTRKATWTSFKNIQKQSGLSFEELERYGLEDKVVSAGGVKQDFHAKFFAGVSRDSVDVLSRSANLLHGTSIENISFHKMTVQKFQACYLDVLKYAPPPPLKTGRSRDVLRFENGDWKYTVLKSLP